MTIYKKYIYTAIILSIAVSHTFAEASVNHPYIFLMNNNRSILHGQISNTKGYKIQNALIRLIIKSTKEISETRTNAEGNYRITARHVGKYELQVIAEGYITRMCEIELPPDVPNGRMNGTPINFKLQPKTDY